MVFFTCPSMICWTAFSDRITVVVSMSFIMVANHDDQFFKAIYYSIRYERYLRKLKNN